MPVFHLSAGPVCRLVAVALLSLAVAGCAAADNPALPELQVTAGQAAAAAPASVLADFQSFAPGPREDWRQAMSAGGMTMAMDAGGMDHATMDHGAMNAGMTNAGAMNHAGMDHGGMQVTEPPADAPAHKH